MALADPAKYGQSVTPYATQSADSYRDEARRRALAGAVQGGGQPSQTSLGANQPYGYRGRGRVGGGGGMGPAVEPERPELPPAPAGATSSAAAAIPSTQKAAATPLNPGAGGGPPNLPLYGGRAGMTPGIQQGGSQPGDFARRVRPYRDRQYQGDWTPGGQVPGGPVSMPDDAVPPVAPVDAVPAAPAGPAAGSFQTRLLEGDPAKLADAAHAAKSPKYDFLQLANSGKYNYNQMGDMLKELQAGPNARLWQGWSADQSGNFNFAGDQSQLAPEWDGVTNIDAVGSYGTGRDTGDWSKSGWRWGVNDGNQMGQGQMPMSGAQSSALGGAIGGTGLTGMDRWRSNNTQTGGDALQVIYSMLGPLLGDLGKGTAIDNLTNYYKP